MLAPPPRAPDPPPSPFRSPLSAGVSMTELDPKVARPGTAGSNNDGRKSRQGLPFPSDFRHMSPKLYQRRRQKEAMGDAWMDEAEAFGDVPPGASDPASRPTTPGTPSRKGTATSQVLMLSPLGPDDGEEPAEGAPTPLSGGKPKGLLAGVGSEEPAEVDEEGQGAMLDEWFLQGEQKKQMMTLMSLEKAQIGEVRKADASPRVPAIPSVRARTARIRQKKAVHIGKRNRPVSSGGRRPTSRSAGGWS